MPVDATIDWAALSRSIAQALGLHYPPARWSDLERGLARFAAAQDHASVQACAERLLRQPWSPDVRQQLAAALCIGETYFFRDAPTFDALRRRILPDLLARRAETRRLVLWSAGCSTGEEPYSLAILLHELLPDLDNWDLGILATDISASALGKAQAAVYGEWSFRGCAADLRERWFRRCEDGRHALDPRVRRMVRLAPLNLVDADPNWPCGVDLLLCRNVLMYFEPRQLRRVVRRLHGSLAADGYLLLSACESLSTLPAFLRTETIHGALVYRHRQAADALAPARGNHGVDGVREVPSGAGVPSVKAREDSPPRSPPCARGDAPRQGSARSAFPRAAPSTSGLPPGRSATAGAPQTDAADAVVEAPATWAAGDSEAVIASLPPLAANATPAMLESLARSYADLGRLDVALHLCERWLLLDKLNPGAHYLHGNVLLERGERPAARRALERALFLQPTHVMAQLMLGTVALAAGQSRQAHHHFDNAAGLLEAMPADLPVTDAEGMTATQLLQLLPRLRAPEVRA